MTAPAPRAGQSVTIHVTDSAARPGRPRTLPASPFSRHARPGSPGRRGPDRSLRGAAHGNDHASPVDGRSPSTSFVQTQAQFYALAVIAGSGLGAVQAASRALLAGLVPPGKEAQMFGFYALCGKSAAILGPLVFGAVSHATGGNQRLGILTVGLFFVVGLALLARMRSGGPLMVVPEGRA